MVLPTTDAPPGRVIGQVIMGAETGRPQVDIRPEVALDTTAQRMLKTIDDLFALAYQDAAHGIVITRSLAAMAEGIRSLAPDDVRRAGSATHDRDVLVTALVRAPIGGMGHPTPDPLAVALLRGSDDQRRMLEAEGPPLLVGEVAARLRLTRQGVDQRRKKGQLLGLKAARHGYLYPAWQFTETGVLPGLGKILATLQAGEHSPWMQLRFFLARRPDLGGRRPLDALRAGDSEAVEAAARRYGEHGGS